MVDQLDPYADPYGDSTGWTQQFGVDYDLRVFFEKGQKALEMQGKIGFLAAHNPEVVGSSPASTTKNRRFHHENGGFQNFLR